MPTRCPECGGLAQASSAPARSELELEHLREALPDVEILRMDADSVSPAGSHEKILSQFREKKVPILIGTQMVTKGLDFENVTLVGVISADQLLYCGDYRARRALLFFDHAGRRSLGTRREARTGDHPDVHAAESRDRHGVPAGLRGLLCRGDRAAAAAELPAVFGYRDRHGVGGG